MQVDVQRAQATYGSGTQVVSHSCGERPEAIICHVTKGTHASPEGEVDGAFLGLGFACYNGGSPLHFSKNAISDDGVGTSNCQNSYSPYGASSGEALSLVQLWSAGGATEDSYATVTTWGTSSITLTWNSTISGNYEMVFTFLYGDDVEAYIGNVRSDAALSPFDITGAGFEPDLIINVGGANVSSSKVGTDFTMFMGMSLNPGTSGDATDIGYVGFWENDADTTVQTCAMASSTLSTVKIYEGSTNGDAVWTDFDANGASLDCSGASKHDLCFLMLKCDNDLDLQVESAPSSTGSWAITDIGFEPICLFGLFSEATSLTTPHESGSNESVGIGVVDSSGNEFTCTIFDEDNVTTTNSYSTYSTTGFPWLRAASSDTLKASFTSYDSGGYTLNFGTAGPAAGIKMAVLAIGPDPSAGGISIPVVQHLRQRTL